MKKILDLFRFAMSMLVGIDMIIALAIFIVATYVIGSWSWLLLLWCVVFSFLPDGDMVIYLLVKKRLEYKSHRRVGHHLLLAIPIYTAIGYGIAVLFKLPVVLYTVTAFIGLIGHFWHDSTEAHGLHWFSPFRWTHYRIEGLRIKRVPDTTWQNILREKSKEWNASTADEFTKRADPISRKQLLVWAFCMGYIIALYCHRFEL